MIYRFSTSRIIIIDWKRIKARVNKLVAGVKVRSSPVLSKSSPCSRRSCPRVALNVFLTFVIYMFFFYFYCFFCNNIFTHPSFNPCLLFYFTSSFIPLSHLLFLSCLSPAPTWFSCPRVCWRLGVLAPRRTICLCVGPGYAMRSPTPGLVWLLEPKTGLRNGSARASPPTWRTSFGPKCNRYGAPVCLFSIQHIQFHWYNTTQVHILAFPFRKFHKTGFVVAVVSLYCWLQDESYKIIRKSNTKVNGLQRHRPKFQCKQHKQEMINWDVREVGQT